jgi:hypothetical protein
MTEMADLDRRIVAWLRDGETVAPSRLAAEIRLAVTAASVSHGRLLRLPWTASRPGLPRALAIVLAGAAVAIALLGLLWASGSVAPQDPSPRATPFPTETARSTAQPSPKSPIPSVEATAAPVETYPPATTLSVPGIELDLPAGWSWPPSGSTMVIIGAVDQIGDPYAGVYNMLLRPVTSAAGPVRFHSPGVGATPDAGMHVLTSGIHESTAPLEADRVRAVLEGQGYVVARSSVKLPTGRAIVLDWDVAYDGPDLHYRAYFLMVGGAVRRIDFATPGAPPSDALAAQLLDIVGSARG